MIPKSLAYKIYWSGRYLERIEDISRACLFALHSHYSLDYLAKEYGLENESDIFRYIKSSFEFLREDLRSFADERILIQVNSLGYILELQSSDLESYFTSILNNILLLGSMLENYLIERKSEMRVRIQEENEPET